MIESAEEFVRLRQSSIKEEYDKSANDNAELEVWIKVLENYPDFKEWVIHNKTVQTEILEMLSKDQSNKIRGLVARKRKITKEIFERLAMDKDENVRCDLMCNTKLSIEQKSQIRTDDSDWLKEKWQEISNNTSR